MSLITTIREKKRGGRKIKSKRKMVNELIALGKPEGKLRLKRDRQ